MADEIRTTEEITAELNAIDTATADLHQNEGEETPRGPSQAAIDASEYEAGRKGWVPKNQYKKDAPWVDAQTFLERGDRFVSNLQRDVATLTKKLEEFEGTKTQFIKFSEDALAKKDAELKTAITALRVQRTQAIREGEDDLAVELEDRIDLLKEQSTTVKELPKTVTQATVAQVAAVDPVLKEWISDGNEWFNEDAGMRDFAIKMGENLIKGGEHVRGRKFLDKIRTIMAQEFPRRFGAKETTAARSGGESSTASSGKAEGGKTSRDLPKVDLEMMRDLISGGYTTEAKFLKSYFSR